MDECDVRLEHGAIAKLIGEMFECGFRFCDDEQAGSVAIQAMHDSRPYARRRVGKLLKVIGECVRECAGMDARGRMDHESGGFVDDNERLVFVNDLDRDWFGSEAGRYRRSSEFDFDLVVLAQLV